MKLEVKVTPKAKINKVIGDKGKYHIYTTAPPDKGKANQSAIKLLSAELNISKSKISIIKGAKSRNKIIEIN